MNARAIAGQGEPYKVPAGEGTFGDEVAQPDSGGSDDSTFKQPYAVRLEPGGWPLDLSVGPVVGVHRLSALEQRLADCPGVERVELASYRGGEASFRVTLESPASLQEVLASVQDEESRVSAYSMDPDRTQVRVRLASTGEDGPA
jgi:hypothetical protein